MSIDAKFIDKQVASAEKINQALDALAPIQRFSKRIDARENGSIDVKFPKGGGSLVSNATDYTSGSIDLSAVSVTVTEQSLSFPITGVELNNDITLADVSDVKLRQFLGLLTKKVTDLLTVGNYGASAVDSSTFTKANMPLLQVEAKGVEKVALLKSAEYAKVAPTDSIGFSLDNGGYGFATVQHVADLDAGVEGFVGGESSVVIATGQSGKFDAFAANERHLLIDTPIGSVLYREWADSNSGSMHGSFLCLFGCAVADVDSGKVLTDLA